MLKSVAILGAGVAMLVVSSMTPHSGGVVVPDMKFVDIKGKGWTLAQASGERATVIALTGTTCPLCKKYGPTLARLEDQYLQKGVRFIFLNPSDVEPIQDARMDFKRLGLNGPYVQDGKLAEKLGAKTTTEIFILDGARKVVYRGAVDDQYGLNYSISQPRQRYAMDALDAVLAGKSPKVSETEAPGCVLGLSAEEEVAATYYKRIASIVQKNCLECHRAGGVAPFSLETYDDVKSRAPMLKFAVEKGIMPPWFAVQQGPSPWKNDRSLSEEDKRDFFNWIDAGMPKGDASDGPKPRKYDSKWAIGQPDATFQIPQPIQVKESGTMPYQVVTVPTNFTEDRWIQAMEVQPTARSVVHHVLIFVKPKGGRGGLGDIGEELSGFFAAYVPGNNHIVYPDGFGKKLPAGATLKFQIHYTPNGTATEDQIKLGLNFAKKPIEHEVQTIGIANHGIRIPPGADNHKEIAQIPVPYDVKVLSFIPHMHVRGKAARYDLVKADGSRETLLDIPRYDFNWQLSYEYAKPLDIAKGSKVEFAGWFDNSENNKANPDPTKTVRWGPQTYDEMHLGYVEYYVPGLKPGEQLRGLRAAPLASVIDGIFKTLDKNQDGFVTAEEAGRAWDRIKEADTNGDGKLTLEEAKSRFGG